MVPDELLGPGALLIASLAAIGFLWRDHLRSDTDDRKERDEWKDIAKTLLVQLPALTGAVEKLTAAIKEYDRRRERATADALERVIKILPPK